MRNRLKPLYRQRYRKKKADPVFGDVEWIVTATYILVTSKGPIDCVRMRAVLSNAFCIHVSTEYLRRHFHQVPERCYSWRGDGRCNKKPGHAGAHRYV